MRLPIERTSNVVSLYHVLTLTLIDYYPNEMPHLIILPQVTHHPGQRIFNVKDLFSTKAQT
jgi:hypothetical protein